jgi:hypothetical protein
MAVFTVASNLLRRPACELKFSGILYYAFFNDAQNINAYSADLSCLSTHFIWST